MAETVARAARTRILSAEGDFFRCARRAIGGKRDDELHDARIAAKRLRYAIEFFCSVLGPTADTALRLLAHLQDRLGAIADDAAFARFYDDLAARVPSDDPRNAGIQRLITGAQMRRAANIANLHVLWNGQEFPPYRDMLAATISAALAAVAKGPRAQ